MGEGNEMRSINRGTLAGNTSKDLRARTITDLTLEVETPSSEQLMSHVQVVPSFRPSSVDCWFVMVCLGWASNTKIKGFSKDRDHSRNSQS